MNDAESIDDITFSLAPQVLEQERREGTPLHYFLAQRTREAWLEYACILEWRRDYQCSCIWMTRRAMEPRDVHGAKFDCGRAMRDPCKAQKQCTCGHTTYIRTGPNTNMWCVYCADCVQVIRVCMRDGALCECAVSKWTEACIAVSDLCDTRNVLNTLLGRLFLLTCYLYAITAMHDDGAMHGWMRGVCSCECDGARDLTESVNVDHT